VAYVEPSYRPADGRYAENPNRMQLFTQYQVISSPIPAIHRSCTWAASRRWASTCASMMCALWRITGKAQPWATGAWAGGLARRPEISQYTYFQQCGGLVTDPVSVELTYGLERIVMYLQGRPRGVGM